MATRSNIGIENEDGSVDYVYCHWDGYPTGVGASIIDMGRQEARALIDKGDMSTVGEHYHEIRNEPWEMVKPLTASSIDDYSQEAFKANNDYAYIITRDGTWMFMSYGRGPWCSLKQELLRLKTPSR